MSNIDPRDFDPTVDGRLRGAVGESRPVPIHASVVTAQARRQRRVRTIAGSVAGLAGGLAVIAVAVMVVPSMMPVPTMQGVPAGVSEQTAEPTTDPNDDPSADPTTVTVTTPSPDETSPVEPTTVPDGTTVVVTAEPQPSCSAALPDKTWTRYTLTNVGISVALPKGMKAYLDKEFDNGWRLDTLATHAGIQAGGLSEMKEILVWPESLAGGAQLDAVTDLGVAPCVTDASGHEVHIGVINNSDFTEILLMVADGQGGWSRLIDFGKGSFYLGSDDNWVPMSAKDKDTVVAIMASVAGL